MENKLFHRIFIIISLIALGFIAAYSLIRDYKFSSSLLIYYYSIFYLILALNFIGSDLQKSDRKNRLIWIITNKNNIIIYCIVTICYSIIFINSDIPILSTFLIVIISLIFYNFLFYYFNYRISLILFWISFYLFAGVIIFSQLPNFQLDLVSKFNPLGGLIVNIFI